MSLSLALPGLRGAAGCKSVDKDGNELRGARFLRQRAAGERFKPFSMLFPHEVGHYAYTSLYVFPCLVVMFSCLRIKPFRNQQQALRLSGGKAYSV